MASQPQTQNLQGIDLESFRGLDEPIKFDAAGSKGFLLIGPTGATVRLSASAYHLLQAVRSGIGFEKLAAALASRRGEAVAAAAIERSYQQILQRLAFAAAPAANGRQKLPAGFWCRWTLLGQRLVGALASRLSILFAPALALPLLVSLVLAIAATGAVGQIGSFDSAAAFWPAYLLFTLSLLAHELGHASAAARYGVAPKEIGFTFYLIFPAFYSNVTSCWQLSRGRRVVVDLGGNYFQLLIGGLYAVAFAVTGWEPLRLAVTMILFGCLLSLNPVFRFDGYWVLADALGITDLSRQPLRIVRHLSARLRRRAVAPLPFAAWTTAVLVLYTPLSFVVWTTFAVRLLPAVWNRLAAYPDLALTTAYEMVAGHIAWDRLHALLSSTVLIVLASLMLSKLAARVATQIRRLSTTSA